MRVMQKMASIKALRGGGSGGSVATEEVTVGLAMADGDQVIEPSEETKVLSKVTITKPDTLIPENIRSGINIGGVVGDFVVSATTKEIEPDFSEGDHTETAVDEVWNEVVVKKPDTLVSENVRNGIDVSGVVGSFIGDTEETTVDLDFTNGDQTVEPSSEGKVLSKVTIKKPEALVPENIATGVEVAGVVGTFVGADDDVGTGAYNIKVIDYDGTLLAEKNLDSGEVFTLPGAPAHEGLVFDGWSSSTTVTDNTVTVENNNIMIGALYHTESGATEVDVVLTKTTGLTVTFLDVLTGMTSIDWGDGTTDSTLSHTYSDYGEYTIKIYGMTAVATGTSSGGIATSLAYHIVAIRLSATVSSIGGHSFNGCRCMKSIAIPMSVTTIGEYAFANCASLCGVVLPSGPTSLAYTFMGSYGLTNVVIPKGVTSIGRQTFYNCYPLTNVVIPNGVTSIGVNAFYVCYSKTGIVIPGSVTLLAASAFYNCLTVPEYDFTACEKVPSLGDTKVFNLINGRCQILVPSSLYSTWIATTNWSTYANYIVAV